jgi:PEP-CTERM motif
MKVRVSLVAALALAISSYGTIAVAGPIIAHSISETMVESRSGGQNFAAYSDSGAGFPNSWANSSAKSTAPGTTQTNCPGASCVGSRFNSDAGIGGAATWFQVNPTLPTAGGLYEVYVTVTHQSGDMAVTSGITQTGGSGLPATTNAFSVDAVNQPGNLWNLVGTLQLDAGLNNPTIRFDEQALGAGDRFYADAVLFAELVPEPASFALIGLGLTGLFAMGRRRSL